MKSSDKKLNQQLVKDIHRNMDLMSTEELMQIWELNDRSYYSDEAFEVIHQLLIERGQNVPEQQQESQHYREMMDTIEEKEDFFAPEKKGIEKGVLGGIIMMAIAIIWFVGGYSAGYIFYYPPILFLIGLYALLKGLFTGNILAVKSKH